MMILVSFRNQKLRISCCHFYFLQYYTLTTSQSHLNYRIWFLWFQSARFYDKRYGIIFDNSTHNVCDSSIIVSKLRTESSEILQHSNTMDISMSYLFAQYAKVTKPLFPPLIHDESTRLTIILLLLPLSLYLLYRTMRYYGQQ